MTDLSIVSTARRRMKTKEAAAFLGLGESTLEKFRHYGGGPVYEKLGRSVVYDVNDLERWAAARKRANTTQPSQGASA